MQPGQKENDVIVGDGGGIPSSPLSEPGPDANFPSSPSTSSLPSPSNSPLPSLSTRSLPILEPKPPEPGANPRKPYTFHLPPEARKKPGPKPRPDHLSAASPRTNQSGLPRRPRHTYPLETKLQVLDWIQDPANYVSRPGKGQMHTRRYRQPRESLRWIGDKRPPTTSEAEAFWNIPGHAIGRWWSAREELYEQKPGSKRADRKPKGEVEDEEGTEGLGGGKGA